MAASDVRKVLRRALFEHDFNSLLLADPETALVEYSLSSGEREAFLKPGPMLYAFALPSIDPVPDEIIRAMPPPPPPPPDPPPEPPPSTTTVLVVIAIIAIIAFTLASVSGSATLPEELEARVRPLVPKIAGAQGEERATLVRQFVNELTRDF
jgi:hypothetical protein